MTKHAILHAIHAWISPRQGVALALAGCFSLTAMAQNHISLAGKWNICYGDKQAQIELPGSMLTNLLGDEVTVDTRWTGSLYDSSFYFNPYMAKYRESGKMKFPFFLTPATHYTGKAVYTRTVRVPKQWKGDRVMLFLERPHIETTVYVNGQLVGRDSTLSVPHEFEVTPYLKYGKDNEITIHIYNGIENVCVGQDSHSVTDQTQGNWNGMAGELQLRRRPMTCIRNLQVYPQAAQRKLEVEAEVMGLKGKGQQLRFVVTEGADGKGRTLVDSRQKMADRITLQLPDEVKLWDEFSPQLYTLTAILGRDTVNTTFGLRDISIRGRQFYMNGHPIWIRGTVGNCCFPLTGYPPTDEESWTKIFSKCKEYGLNMMRFHSYCPPEAAFNAADKLGFYLQPEGPSWPNHGVKLRRGMTIDRYLLEETHRMVRAYGNHPSFCMLAAGNEPAGDWVSWCADFIDYWHQTGDKRRVYCGASVGGGWAWDTNSDYHVKGGARGLDWDRRAPQSADDYYDQMLRPRNFKTNRVPAYALTNDTLSDGTIEKVNNSPILAHEKGQWCAFPDLTETTLYKGPYKASNFDIFGDLLRDHGMASQAQRFLHASGKLQTLAYKYETERNLRTPDYAGFQYLGLNDYSGQGTALVGVLNVFWKEKGYCDATDWTQFCSPVVPLARMPKFVFTNDEELVVPMELYNARQEMKEVMVSFTLMSDQDEEGNTMIASQTATHQRIPLGKNLDLGTFRYSFADVKQPIHFTLKAELESADSVEATNSWELWVYPKQISMPEAKDIYLTDTLDERTLSVLARGGKVLIEAAGKVRYGSDVKQTYLPVFWNTSWFKMRPPHTTGAVIDKDHPLFDRFVTDDWANLQWWELLNRAQVMNLAAFPDDYQSPVQPIDTWHVSRKLGMIVEAKVNGGKLLMTTMDISSRLDERVVARQMRQAILSYMESDRFQPMMKLAPSIITQLFEEEAPAVNMYTKESPDELKPKIK